MAGLAVVVAVAIIVAARRQIGAAAIDSADAGFITA